MELELFEAARAMASSYEYLAEPWQAKVKVALDAVKPLLEIEGVAEIDRLFKASLKGHSLAEVKLSNEHGKANRALEERIAAARAKERDLIEQLQTLKAQQFSEMETLRKQQAEDLL